VGSEGADFIRQSKLPMPKKKPSHPVPNKRSRFGYTVGRNSPNSAVGETKANEKHKPEAAGRGRNNIEAN